MPENGVPDTLLDVHDLHVVFEAEEGAVHALRGVSFHVGRGETLGIVGESGCGKSVSCMALLRLLPGNSHVVGEISFDGRDLLALDTRALDRIRGHEIAMIFQDPAASLNPVHTIGRQIEESLRLHRGMDPGEAQAEALRLLARVGISEAKRRMRAYPHQLSGGMNQRAMIAMALACRPKLLIADEPTTALDVTIQAQIIELLRDLQAEFGMSMILITHDLGVVAELADRVAVMYAGRVVEEADVRTLFHAPSHPYTVGLLASMPRIDATAETLHPIEGAVPSPRNLPAGCAFGPRCSFADAACRDAPPPLDALGEHRRTACFHPRALA
jgi:oligopeptide/dipeptide ABC transporter ATP-binding protein